MFRMLHTEQCMWLSTTMRFSVTHASLHRDVNKNQPCLPECFQFNRRGTGSHYCKEKLWYIHTQTYKQAHTPTAQPHKCWNPQWRNIKQQQVLLEYGQMHSPHSWGSIRSPLYREVRLLSRSLSLFLCVTFFFFLKRSPRSCCVYRYNLLLRLR